MKSLHMKSCIPTIIGYAAINSPVDRMIATGRAIGGGGGGGSIVLG